LWNEINKENLETKEANFIYQILSRLGNLTIKLDSDLTDLAREAAVNDVPIMDRKLEPGDIIVNKGETVTREIAILLRLQGYTEDVFPNIELIIVVLCVLMLPLLINILNKGAGEQKPTWWCIVFIMLTAWISETLAARIEIHGAGSLAGATVAYLCLPDYFAFCLSIAALGSGVFMITSQTVAYKFMLMALGVFASIVGFYVLRNCESRRQLSTRIFLMSFLMTIVKMLMRTIQGPPFVQDNFRLFIPLGEFWQEAGLFFFYESCLTQIFLLVLQYCERFLDTISILTISEISNPSTPLLRDLQQTAPGTYQHSLTIATLIEAVGLRLGMNTNLLRAGAYYHDIGKIRKPHFFVENQGGGHNLHDDMKPTLSSITIISHVKDGVEIARKSKLPKRIRDFIAEHHGTTSTRYFYNKAVAEAKANGKGEKVEWSSFCYPGPKPQSRETALLMIVDSVEAAVRAANVREIGEQSKTSNAIEKIITQVINSKINERQFDDVQLTFRDLDIIKGTLVSVLTSMYHTRTVKKINK
ncbi:MAG: HDIG domain-containing protein, partial [Synergistaceae bacterium]|nr:HDIG domain-containing protein [Synergistaceae bacterium]